MHCIAIQARSPQWRCVKSIAALWGRHCQRPCLVHGVATIINIPHWNIIDCRPNRLIKVTVVSLVPAARQRSRSCCWSVLVPAADAKIADGASEVTRRTSNSPSLTGTCRLASDQKPLKVYEIQVGDSTDTFSQYGVNLLKRRMLGARLTRVSSLGR